MKICCLLLACTINSGLVQDDQVMTWGREHCRLFFNGELPKIWDNLTAEMKNVFGSKEKLEAFQGQIVTHYGLEQEILSEMSNAQGLYRRISTFANNAGNLSINWGFDQHGAVTGLLIKAVGEAPSIHLAYQTKTDLRLPLEGEWFVVWGGRTVAQNYHASYPDQRFAYDLLKVEGGVSHRSDGRGNEDYYCFGQKILAPGQGVVHAAVDGVDDNVPGIMNAHQLLGNHVIIDHGNGEFSFLAHFKKGSVGVEAGDTVAAGDLLGLSGNSGHSSEPHLHYHLQNTPVFQQGEGLPAFFNDYLADGATISRGEPIKGQAIAPH